MEYLQNERQMKLKNKRGSGRNFVVDDYVAGLFAAMKPGSVMFTFWSIDSRLGPSRSEANALRRKHKLSDKDSDDASFYECEEFDLNKKGESMVSWGSLSTVQTIFKYTRLRQKGRKEAMFLCCNPGCENAQKSIALQAERILEPTIEKRKLPDGKTIDVREEGKLIVGRCPCGVDMQTSHRRSRRGGKIEI